jgi:Flp pilus assembly protein TadD
MHQKAVRRLAGRVALLSTALCTLTLASCDSLGGIGTFIAGRDTPSSPSSSIKNESLLEFADRARATGDLSRAVTLYRRVLADDSSNMHALIGLGETLNALGSPNEAAEVFKKALDHDSKSAPALRGQGSVLLALNEPQRAIDLFKQSIAIAPDARAYDGLGVAEDLMGDFAAAKQAYLQGLAVAPNDLLLRNNLGLSEALAGDYDAAIATLRSVATDPAAGPRQRSNLALALALAGRTEQAAEIARIDLDDATVQRNLANYAELRSLPPQARAQALLRPGEAGKAKPSTPPATPGAMMVPPAVPVGQVQSTPLTAAAPAMPPAAMPSAPPAETAAMPPPRKHRMAKAKHAPAAEATNEQTAAAPAEPSTAAPEAPLAKGKSWVQVGAFRIESNAKAIREKLAKEDQDLLQGAEVQIRQSELRQSHDVLYRVLIGPLDSRADADKLCGALTERKIDCIRVKS